MSSKKRNLSSDAEIRNSKIIKTSESKENISNCADGKALEATPHESNNDVLEISSDSETETPKNEFTLFIKLKFPTSSKNKSRKRFVSDSISKSKPKDGEVDEDSVVYLDEKEIRNSC